MRDHEALQRILNTLSGTEVLDESLEKTVNASQDVVVNVHRFITHEWKGKSRALGSLRYSPAHSGVP